jgi:hypothetical protein
MVTQPRVEMGDNELYAAGEQRRRHVETERLRGLEIDHQLIF